ncbi:MAG: GDP-L-fucose synthase [Leptospiraceae bacterium]|nr:GDP-L-fucose synthase [Leptospiraceae bacterium]
MELNSKIYLPGHTGLLGNAILKKVNEDGYQNVITKTHKGLELTDKQSLDAFLEETKPEYIILAAGKTGGIVANKTYPADFLHQNVSIQDNFFELSIKHNVKALVFYASSCVYPKMSPQPIREEYLFTGEIEATSEAYAAAKIAGMLACKAYNRQYQKTKFLCLLPNSMFGPYDNFDLEQSHVLSALIRKIHEAKVNKSETLTLWGSGKPEREFIFSEDVADATLFAIKNANKFENSHYNIGSGTSISIKELANVIADIVDYKGKILWDESKPDGTPKKLLDSSRFNALGWKKVTSMDAGIQVTYQWFLKNYNNLIKK